jgi:hypothetical protein
MTKYSYDRTAKTIRLTPKEIQRADSGYTVVVRPQADGGYMVAAVKVEGQNGLELGRSMTRFVDDQGQIPEAVKDVVRWMDKMGIPGDMGGASRERVASNDVASILDFLFNGLEHTSNDHEAVKELMGWGYSKDLSEDLVQSWYKARLHTIANPMTLQTKAEDLVERLLEKHNAR